MLKNKVVQRTSEKQLLNHILKRNANQNYFKENVSPIGLTLRCIEDKSDNI